MKNIDFETLINILKNEADEPFTNYILEDFDGNQIYAEDLFILDFYAMRTWLVDEVRIDNQGRATIILNSGSFKDFHFRNIQ